VNTVTDLLQALIRTPSVNPEGNPGTDGINEQACAELVGNFLRDSGATVELREVMPGRPNVIGTWPTDRPGKPILIFAPHTDTVSVAGMTIDPFSGEIRDGRVWGRGSSDTKGSMAAMLWALRSMREEIPSLSHEIVFVGLCSEEAGQYGVKAFVEERGADLRKRGAFAIAGEPTNLNAVIAHKGSLWLTLTTRGKAVHAAQPERGESAIYKMADLLHAIRDTIAPSLRASSHPLLGATTISAGTIRGGSKINIVPDLCRAEVDIRFLPGDDTILERVSAQLRAACPDVEIAHVFSHPMLTDREHPLVHTLEKCGAQCVGAPWFSDAAIFAQAGIPAIACGPGSINQAHTKDEFLAIEDLERGVEFFRDFLWRLSPVVK
jgi:acetylornithine deacetylase/succinyl-diaminopimelate desuccinylase-like protein